MFDLLRNHRQLGCCSGDKGKDLEIRTVGCSGMFMSAIFNLVFLVDDSHVNDLITTGRTL